MRAIPILGEVRIQQHRLRRQRIQLRAQRVQFRAHILELLVRFPMPVSKGLSPLLVMRMRSLERVKVLGRAVDDEVEGLVLVDGF